MPMQKPERSSFTPMDFLEWRESGNLVLTPKFQRRGVWKNPAKSYLIDTILRGMPVPPIFLRTSQSADKKKLIREVVDGQQRISAITDYVNGKYALATNLGTTYAGKRFDELAADEQDTLRQYPLLCEVFAGIGDEEVLQIFSRLNTYSVPLNAQELRNGRYFGPFKQQAFALASEHLEFWRLHRIFTEQSIARMLEVELVSELLIVQLDGIQDKKKTINVFYERFDETFPLQQKMATQFRAVIDVISTHLHEVLASSEFRRTPIFYSLFGAIYHRLFGMPNQTTLSPKSGKKISAGEGQKLIDTVLTLSEAIERTKADDDNEPPPQNLERFVTACLRQTDNIRPRQTRLTEIYNNAFL